MGQAARKIAISTANGQGTTVLALPAGTPAWITLPLVADTLDCWQLHYAKALTGADAIEILTTVGRLFDAFGNDNSADQTDNSP